MTQFVFTELLGGRVLRIDDLDESSLESVGDTVLAGPSGPSFNEKRGVLVAGPGLHEVALAESGAGWTRFGTHGGGEGEFRHPAATGFLDSGRLVVLDSGNGRLVFIDDISGSGWATYGHRGLVPSEGGFVDPRGIAVDTADRIWVSDPGANRLTRIDAPDGSGWKVIALPTAANPPLPYGLAAHQDGVAVLDVGNARLLVLDDTGAPSVTVDLADGTWVSPAFVTSLGDSLVIADVVANELRLLEPEGDGYAVTARLRGSPPDLVEPRFDSLGGVGS